MPCGLIFYGVGTQIALSYEFLELFGLGFQTYGVWVSALQVTAQAARTIRKRIERAPPAELM